MSDLPNAIHKKLKRNDRYFLAFIAAFVLGLLLLFYKELDPWMQKQFVPSFVVYLIGAALVAQIQQMFGRREKLRCRAKGVLFVGTAPLIFGLVVLTHALLFGAWVYYLIAHPITVV